MSWHSRRVVAEQPNAKRKPRLGLILRLAIYVPLLGFFSWQAWERFAVERDAADEVFREHVSGWLEQAPQTIMLPNGETLPMLTPEQAEAQGYRLPAHFAEPDEGAAEPEEPAAPAEEPAAEPDERAAPEEQTAPAEEPAAAPEQRAAPGPAPE